jgi:hypothetical protein
MSSPQSKKRKIDDLSEEDHQSNTMVLIPIGLICNLDIKVPQNTIDNNVKIHLVEKYKLDYRRRVQDDVRETVESLTHRLDTQCADITNKLNIENNKIMASRKANIGNVSCEIALATNSDCAHLIITALSEFIAPELVDLVLEYVTNPLVEPLKIGDVVHITNRVHRPLFVKILSLTPTEATVVRCERLHRNTIIDVIQRTSITSHLWTRRDIVYFKWENRLLVGLINFMRWDGMYNITACKELRKNSQIPLFVGDSKDIDPLMLIIAPVNILGMVLLTYIPIELDISGCTRKLDIIDIRLVKNNIVITMQNNNGDICTLLITNTHGHTYFRMRIDGHMKSMEYCPIIKSYMLRSLRVGDIVSIDGTKYMTCSYPIDHTKAEVRPIPLVDDSGNYILTRLEESPWHISPDRIIHPVTNQPLTEADLFVGALVSVHHFEPYSAPENDESEVYVMAGQHWKTMEIIVHQVDFHPVPPGTQMSIIVDN